MLKNEWGGEGLNMNKPNLNPMFNNKKRQVNHDWDSLNVRKKEPKPRKTRIDKKHDIKIPLDSHQMKIIRIRAFEHNLTITQYSALLLKKGLKLDQSLFPEVDYNKSNLSVHPKLESYYYELLFHYSLSFELKSMRKTAHRILVEMIKRGG